MPSAAPEPASHRSIRLFVDAALAIILRGPATPIPVAQYRDLHTARIPSSLPAKSKAVKLVKRPSSDGNTPAKRMRISGPTSRHCQLRRLRPWWLGRLGRSTASNDGTVARTVVPQAHRILPTRPVASRWYHYPYHRHWQHDRVPLSRCLKGVMIKVWPRIRFGGRAGSRKFALVHSRVVRLPGPEIQIHSRQQDRMNQEESKTIGGGAVSVQDNVTGVVFEDSVWMGGAKELSNETQR
jgi:hypothetical protein